ncbi:MAG: hypothetical protein Q9201_002957 [Fulgogasparrea decipioides]
MRLSLGLSSAALLIAVGTAASDAHIYISASPEGHTPQALSPATTRLLLARRLGLSQYHSLEGADESTLGILNNFGGEQRALFSPDEELQDQRRNLVILEGVEDLNGKITRKSKAYCELTILSGFPPLEHRAAFTISDSINPSYTRRLVQDFDEQAQNAPADGRQVCSFRPFGEGSSSWGAVSKSSVSISCPVVMHSAALTATEQPTGFCKHSELGSPDLIDSGKASYWISVLDRITALERISPTIPSQTTILHVSLSDIDSSYRYYEAKKDLSDALSRLLRTGSIQETTVVLMPPFNSRAKHTSSSPYGSYAMPNRRPHQARAAQSEALLTAPSAPEISLPSHRHSVPQTLKASSVPKPGILPVCQPNLEKLIDATNNCSGHGTPYLKRNGSSEDSKDKTADCYACKCGKTVLSRGEGKGVKTVIWAGPACSKKDVSMPFWLLAGISLALVATVSWGVGLLFSIGQEELPSVIGAGVVGPRAQK